MLLICCCIWVSVWISIYFASNSFSHRDFMWSSFSILRAAAVGWTERFYLTSYSFLARCSGKFTVVTAPGQDVIQGKKGSRQELVWNFICFGALHSNTVRCKRNNSEEITERDGYYNIKRIRSARNNEVALQHIITISNFSRSESITCKTNAYGSPSATFILVLEEGKNIHIRKMY
jgi:hypothetical protein